MVSSLFLWFNDYLLNKLLYVKSSVLASYIVIICEFKGAGQEKKPLAGEARMCR